MSRAAALHKPILKWYAEHARDLPWRSADASPWAVLVSEVMLQQTPVVRVQPVWQRWMSRWPDPAALAAEAPGEAVRAWERLGYPRRAIRLHSCAQAIVDQHHGEVPSQESTLLTLPGIGTYTAAAVAAFAFGVRTTVVDTNVRRVLARSISGAALPAPSLTKDDTDVARQALPADRHDSVRWNVGVMELGALVCTARAPRCDVCPVRDRCAWLRAGRPAYTGPAHRGQSWHGSDRQCRGALLQRLRDHDGWLPAGEFVEAWSQNDEQRERCLAALVQEGLIRSTQIARPSHGLARAIWYGFDEG
ncbi:MAG: A/G-specific adenine glycosylase [Ornithinimicrobium sp.]